MARTSVWANADSLSATIRQIAIDNGTPNVMPTLDQMSETPGLATWVKKKEGGVRKFSSKLNLVMKPNVVPSDIVISHNPQLVYRGTTVFIHNKTHLCPAIVLDKGRQPGSLIVLALTKKMARKHVQYGVINNNAKYTWCHSKDIPKEKLLIRT
jgi:hypothetical protein